MRRSFWKLADRLLPAATGAAALAVYLITLSPGAYPGVSSGFAVQQTGVLPVLSPAFPLWSTVCFLARLLPGPGSPVLRLNLLSAVFGALSVAVLCRLMILLVLQWTEENQNLARVAYRASAARVAGLGAALFLAFSSPFWTASTRAHPAAFDVLLLLLLARLLLAFSVSASRALLLLLAFAFGVCITESAVLVLFFPVFAVVAIRTLLREEQPVPRALGETAAAGLLGLSAYFIIAWVFTGSEGYRLREYAGYFHVLWVLWRDQASSLSGALPQTGWIVVVFLAVVPAVSALMVAQRGLNGEREWSLSLLHIVLTVLALVLLLNAPIAPWPMRGRASLIATPYLLNAAMYGYLLAFWLLRPSYWWEIADTAPPRFLRPVLAALFAAAGLATAAVAPFRNAAECDGRQAAFLQAAARDIVRCMGKRTWLVTDGQFDEQILAATAGTGREVLPLNAATFREDSLLRRSFERLPSLRLRNLAQAGVINLLLEWIPSDPAIGESLAVLSSPDFWVAGNMAPRPHRTLYLAGAGEDEPAALLREHEEFWTSLMRLRGRPAREEVVAAMNAGMARHLGAVANNLGVALQDRGATNEAYRAYAWARRLDTNNISALLNQAALVRAGYTAADAQEVLRGFEEFRAHPVAASRLWALSRYHGYVRSAEAYQQMGMSWALSGRRGTAVTGLRTALALSVADAQRDEINLTLAGVYEAQDEETKGEAIYREVLARNPTNVTALVGMNRLLRERGEFEAAADHLRRAEAAGAPPFPLAMERARLHVALGRLDEAQIVLRQLTDMEPERIAPRALLAGILLHRQDRTGLEELASDLSRLRAGAGLAAYIRAELALRDRDPDTARSQLDRALTAEPGNVQVLTRLLELNFMQHRTETSRSLARRLLQARPDDHLAHYAMAVAQMEDGDYGMAEDSLRRSVAASRKPAALNDLAWVLQKRGEFAESEKLAREAVSLAPDLFAAWDTLGTSLLHAGRVEEAEAAYQKALALQPGNSQIMLNLAALHVRKGDRASAEPLLKQIREDPFSLPGEDRQRLEELELAARRLPAP